MSWRTVCWVVKHGIVIAICGIYSRQPIRDFSIGLDRRDKEEGKNANRDY